MTSITDETNLMAAISEAAKTLSSSSTAIIAVNDGNGNAAIYQVTGGSSTGATDETLKLIATVDNNIDDGDIIASGVITFA